MTGQSLTKHITEFAVRTFVEEMLLNKKINSLVLQSPSFSPSKNKVMYVFLLFITPKT
jgi:hypothetical protein